MLSCKREKPECEEINVYECLLEHALTTQRWEDEHDMAADTLFEEADQVTVDPYDSGCFDGAGVSMKGECLGGPDFSMGSGQQLLDISRNGGGFDGAERSIKKLDNVLRYRLRSAGQDVMVKDVLQKWTELKKSYEQGDIALLPVMQELVDSAVKGTWDASVLKQDNSHEDVEEEGAKGQWLPWETYERKQGKVMALELVKNGSAETRLHKGLVGKNSSIPFPENQEVRMVTDFDVRKARKIDATRCESQKEIGETETVAYRQLLQCRVGSRAPAPPCTQRPAAPQAKALTDMSDEDKKAAEKLKEEQKKNVKNAIKAVKLQHADFDRKKSDWQGILMKSKANDNTAGCKIEQALEKVIVEAESVDNAMMSHHTTYVAGYDVTADMIASMKESAKELMALTKQAAAKVTALNSSFKV